MLLKIDGEFFKSLIINHPASHYAFLQTTLKRYLKLSQSMSVASQFIGIDSKDQYWSRQRYPPIGRFSPSPDGSPTSPNRNPPPPANSRQIDPAHVALSQWIDQYCAKGIEGSLDLE